MLYIFKKMLAQYFSIFFFSWERSIFERFFTGFRILSMVAYIVRVNKLRECEQNWSFSLIIL